MATVTGKLAGTFTGNGATANDIVVSKRGRLKLEFVSTATISVLEYSEQADAFIPMGDNTLSPGAITESVSISVDGGGNRIKLSCADYVGDVVFELLPGR